jgi:glycosyltransferase involved in cell wall biosynthesis
MRCGVPVISTDCPLGPAEIITPGVNGRLVPVGDARALSEAMLDLIADESARREMGRAALAGAHRYDAEPIVARYEGLFRELRAARRKARIEEWKRRVRGVFLPQARPFAKPEDSAP